MYRKFKKVVLGIPAHVTPSIFVGRVLRSEALVYNSYFFSEQPFYGSYSTLDFHTNTVISHAFAYSSRWRRKPWKGLFCDTTRVRSIGRSGFRFKIRFRIYNRTRNPKTDFTEIMLRHLFLDFHLYRSIMKSEKGFEKYSTKSEIYWTLPDSLKFRKVRRQSFTQVYTIIKARKVELVKLR